MIEVFAMQRQLTDPLDDSTAALPFSGSVQGIAQSALKFRARRRRILGSYNFSDPAWDLLLVLASGDPDAWTSCDEIAQHAGVTAKVIERFAGLLALQGLVALDEGAVRLTLDGQKALVRLIR